MKALSIRQPWAWAILHAAAAELAQARAQVSDAERARDEALARLAESEGRAAFADTLLDRDLHIPADILREAEAAEAAARSRGRDPLTALEAAERRLLASEGWTYVGLYGGEQWQHAKHGREGRMTALSIARNTAKKGGS